MMTITWLAAFPLTAVPFMLLNLLLGGASVVLRTLVFTMVSLVTYVVGRA